MMIVVLLGLLVVIGLIVVLVGAYKINARSFEVTTSFGRLASFSIKIVSPDEPAKDDGTVRQALPTAFTAASHPEADLAPAATKRPITAPNSSALIPGHPQTMKSR
jgi:hypothetical protein